MSTGLSTVQDSMTVEILIGSNADDMIDYLDSLDDGQLQEAMRTMFEDQSNISRLQGRVKSLIKRLVYDRYTPENYERTNALLDSFTVSSGNQNDEAGLVVYSDPNVSPVKRGGSDESYAVFFERPDEYKTFIHPRGQASEPENYRPFFSELFELVKDHSITTGSRALSRSAARLRPQSLLVRLSE